MNELSYIQRENGLYEIHSNEIKLTILNQIFQQLFEKTVVDKADISTNIQVDNYLEIINKNCDKQNNCILYLTKYHGVYPYCFLIEKWTGKLYFTFLRFSRKYFNETILEGQLMSEVFYDSVTRSMDSLYLPPAKDFNETQNDDDDEDDDEKPNVKAETKTETKTKELVTKEDNNLPIKKQKIIEPLLPPDEFLNKKIPLEKQKYIRNVFYVRNVYLLESKKVNGDYTKILPKLNDLLYNSENLIQDYLLSNLLLKYDHHNPVYSAKPLKLKKSHPKTMLYKPLPYIFLNGKEVSGVEKRLRFNPLFKNRFNWDKIKNFKIEYYGPDKPAVFILKALDPREKKKGKSLKNCSLKQIGYAFTPNIECQEYVICLLKKIGYQRAVIMKCVYDKKTKNWVPIKYLENKSLPDIY